MGVMTKMRDNTAIVLYVLIFAFGVLWVVSDVCDPQAMMNGPRALGVVNGDAISFEEYNQRIEYYNNAYTAQTGASLTPELRAIYENQVWDELVNQKLLEQKMDELGITVTDQELLDMVFGDNPDPLIRQYFAREDGTIDRFVVENVLTDPTYSQETMAIEVQLRQKRRQEKLSNYITAGLQVTDQMVKEEFDKRNTFADVSYVRFPYSEVAESELSFTDSDIKTYYNEHKDRYKSEENYRARFVSFSTLPTASDTATILSELDDLRGEFAATDNDSTFLITWQSTTGYNGVYVKKADLREDYAPVLDVAEGEVTGVINLGASAAIIKKIDERGDEIKFAVMSHAFEALPATQDEAYNKAQDFELYATEESSFDEEAERAGLTVSEIFATKGNSFISGIGSSQQVLDFMAGGKVGDISEPIELASQFVVVELTEINEEGFRSLDEVRAQIETQVKNEKRKEITLQKVQDLLATNSTLEALSSASGKEVQTQNGLTANSMVLVGAGREPSVIGAIFGLEQGETSKAIAGENGVYVVSVSAKTLPAASTLTPSATQSIRTELEQQMNQRYLSVWLEQLKDEADIEDNRSRLIR